jgi:hypothetical protein
MAQNSSGLFTGLNAGNAGNLSAAALNVQGNLAVNGYSGINNVDASVSGFKFQGQIDKKNVADGTLMFDETSGTLKMMVRGKLVEVGASAPVVSLIPVDIILPDETILVFVDALDIETVDGKRKFTARLNSKHFVYNNQHRLALVAFPVVDAKGEYQNRIKTDHIMVESVVSSGVIVSAEIEVDPSIEIDLVAIGAFSAAVPIAGTTLIYNDRVIGYRTANHKNGMTAFQLEHMADEFTKYQRLFE